MEETNDIDANGYWTIDNYEALMGLAAYRWLAQQVGNSAPGQLGRVASTPACWPRPTRRWTRRSRPTT